MKVAVLMGGSSFEREFSLKSGRFVTRALESAGHTVLPLDTTSTLVETLRAQKPDVVYSALHGKHGEDGTIQSLLEFLDIPFVGSLPHSCRLAYNKSVLPHILATHRADCGTQDPPAHEQNWTSRINLAAVTVKEMGAASSLDLIASKISEGYPVAVKPAHGGSAMGISKVEKIEDMASALLDAYSFDADAIIEPWISGTEIAVGIVGNGAHMRILPPIEIAPKQGFFDTACRIDPELVDYYCPVRPASLAATPEQAEQALEAIKAVALEVYTAYRCRDLSRIDMIWDGKKPLVLELNVSPGMSERSLFPMACKAAGITFSQMLEELLEAAVSR